MKKFLFIFYLGENDSYDCFGIVNQLMNIDGIDILFMTENNKFYLQYNKILYQQNNIILVKIDQEKRLLEIIKNFLQKYSAFFLINNTKIIIKKEYTNNFFDKIQKEQKPILLLDNNNQNIGTVFSLKELIKSKLYLNTDNQKISSSLMDSHFAKISQNFLNSFSITTTKKDKTKEKDSVFYEDHKCVFSLLLGNEDIVDSMTYLNKNNNKIYHIKSNISGIIIGYSGEKMSVEWLIENRKLRLNYTKKNEVYIPD
jgi:hypothetical protein